MRMKIESVMIVDDCESDHFISQHVINKFNPSIKIFNAYDGKEALKKLESLETQPTLILLDINMPGMNGFAFLEEYQKWGKPASVVAMLTSSAQEDDHEKALKYDVVKNFFIKPVSARTLEVLEKEG